MSEAKMRRSQAGLTLIEVMIATAIMAFMMVLSWRTLAGTNEARRTFEDFEYRNHEVRVALGRVVADFEGAYLSRNEDQNASNPRTMFVARATGSVPEVKFSTLNHRVLWADANESEQTVIQYIPRKNKDGGTDWLRRELRRPSNQPFDDEPAEFDLLLTNIQKVKIEFWNWKNLDWQDTWDTTQADGQKGWLPSRVRIAVTIKDNRDKDITLTTQARILMQEPLNFVQ